MKIENLKTLGKWTISFTPTINEDLPTNYEGWWNVEEALISYSELLRALLLREKKLTEMENVLFHKLASYCSVPAEKSSWMRTPEETKLEITYLIVNREEFTLLLKNILHDPEIETDLPWNLLPAIDFLEQIKPQYKGIRLGMEWGWG